MKKVLSFLAAFVLLGAFATSAWGANPVITPSGQTIYYNYNSSTQTITITSPGNRTWGSYTKPIGALVIPDSITHSGVKCCVTSIGDYAFYSCSGLTSVTIPNSVTSIGSSAFYQCTSLTSVTIGRGVTSIGNYAFRNCSSMTSVIFNADSCILAGDPGATMFYGCNNLTSITFGNNVKRIPSCLCTGCSGLTSVSIPNSVTSIGDYAFKNCGGLTSVTIGSSVTLIGNYAFQNCTGLTSVTIPNSVTSIGYDAFYGCSGLTSVSIGNGVTSIGNYAFQNCTGLTTITIGSGVTSIGNSAFSGCSGLTSVIFNADSCITAGSTWYLVFDGCSNLTSITFGNNVKRIPSYLCNGCSGLTSVSIPNSVTSIGDYAFKNCGGLTSVTIGNGVTLIDSYAFQNCTSLTSLTIPNSVTSIGQFAFYDCSGLDTLTVGYGLTSIGTYAFQNDSIKVLSYNSPDSLPFQLYRGQLTNVTIGDSVTMIGNNAFRNCSGLTSVTIGSGVTSIGNYAFYGCSGLTSLTIPNSVTSIGNYAFLNCTGLTSVTIGSGVTSIGNYAFDGCSGLTSVTIGSGVTSIGEDAFYGCSGLTSLTIPNSVTSIGYGAFNGCSGLDTVYMMPSTPPYLGTDVFYNNASGRVFIIACGAYDNYYNVSSSNQWYTYRNALRPPTININVTVQSSNAARGTAAVVLGPGNAIVRCDSTVVVQATANYGYHFDHWSNGSTANPDTVALSGDSTITAFFLPNSYTITGNSANLSRGTVTGSATVYYLDTVTLTAIANEHYHLDHWTYTNENNNNTSTQTGGNTLTLVATRNRTATAYFVPDQHQLTVNVDNPARGSVSGGGTYDYNTSHTITATANYGYHFDHWSNGSTTASTSITLTGDSTVTAYFAVNSYTVTGSSANTARGTVTGTATVDYLDTVTLTATANYGYHIDHWTYTNQNNNNTSTQTGGNTLTLVATRDRTATAYFNPNQYQLTVNADNSSHGTVSGGGTYDYLTSHTITATANTGYHFDHWSTGSTANPTTITLTGDSTVTAYFERNSYNLTVNVNNTSLGTVATPDGTSALYQDTLIAVATPIDHHHVASWQGQGIVATSAHKDTVWVAMSQNRTLTCTFAIDTHTVAVAANDIARGMVETSGTEFVYGTPCTVTATAYTGYTFQSWSNGVTANPYTFAVMEDVELTAIFLAPGEQTFTVSVSVNDPAMGSATVNGNATASVLGGTEVTLTATPNSGYRFVRWDDNNTDNPRTVTVTSDMSFTAYFEADGGTEGIEDIDASNIKLFVESGRIHVTLDGQPVDEFRVYDAIGRVVYHATHNNVTPALPSGVYLVKMAGLPTRRVVVVR